MKTERVEVGGADGALVAAMPTLGKWEGGFSEEDGTVTGGMADETAFFTMKGTRGVPKPAEAGGKFPFSSAMNGQAGVKKKKRSLNKTAGNEDFDECLQPPGGNL